MPAETEQLCQFPGVLGLDRILCMQSFPDSESEHSLHSLPVPPKEDAAGEERRTSCNIVVMGRPGTGKSTLGLEMAGKLRICQKGNGAGDPATVLYYGLEQHVASLIARAGELEPKCCVWCQGPDTKFDTADLRKKLEEAGNTPKNFVLFPRLSPRPLEQTAMHSDGGPGEPSIFWKRYGEIRNLVNRLQTLETSEDFRNAWPPLRMVVIDSLNVFADKPITRYLIEQLFSFFSEQGLIGVFIAEDPEASIGRSAGEPVVSPGVANLADVVIKLDWKTDEGYSFRSIEVAKSRHTANVYGTQQMKIRKRGLEVYPSLHSWYTYLLSGTGESPVRTTSRDQRFSIPKTFRGSDRARSVPDGVYDTLGNEAALILLSGPKKTRKSHLALQYAAATDSNRGGGDRFLLVTFDDKLPDSRTTSSSDVVKISRQGDGGHLADLISSQSKGTLETITLEYTSLDLKSDGYELWLSPGYLLSEEFVYFLHRILTSKERLGNISRVILRDIGELPMRHPIMSQQILKGSSNYIPVLIELFRKLGVDALFVCSDGEKVGGDREDEDSRNVATIERGLDSAADFHIQTGRPKHDTPGVIPLTLSVRTLSDIFRAELNNGDLRPVPGQDVQ